MHGYRPTVTVRVILFVRRSVTANTLYNIIIILIIKRYNIRVDIRRSTVRSIRISVTVERRAAGPLVLLRCCRGRRCSVILFSARIAQRGRVTALASTFHDDLPVVRRRDTRRRRAAAMFSVTAVRTSFENALVQNEDVDIRNYVSAYQELCK